MNIFLEVVAVGDNEVTLRWTSPQAKPVDVVDVDPAEFNELFESALGLTVWDEKKEDEPSLLDDI